MKADLRADEFQSFLGWYAKVVGALAAQATWENVSLDLLTGFPAKAPEVRLSKELQWDTAYLDLHADVIVDLLQGARRVEAEILTGRLTDAHSSLKELTDAFGHSFWSVQLSIALAQMMGGLESQKKIVRAYREEHGQSLLSYVAYFTGVRNEEKTTRAHFITNIERHLAASSFREGTNTYLRFRLAGDLPYDEIGMSALLSHEASNHPFDLFETLVRLLQEVCANSQFAHLRPLAARVIRRLNAIPDPRLEKLSLSLGQEVHNRHLAKRPADGISLALGSAEVPLRDGWRELAAPDPWNLFLAGLVRAGACSPIKAAGGFRQWTIVGALASVLRQGPEAAANLEIFEKYCLNLSGLPSVAGIGNLLPTLGLVGGFPTYDFRMLSLNSRFRGFGDACLVDLDNNPAAKVDDDPFFSAVDDDPNHGGQIKPSKAVSVLASCLREFQASNFEALIDTHDRWRSCLGSCLSAVAGPAVIHALKQTHRLSDVVARIAELVSANPHCHNHLPIEQSLKGLSSHDLKSMRGQLSPLVALHAMWRVTDDDRTAATIRHELNALLRARGCSRPSELARSQDFLNDPLSEYFLRYVCTPHFMDLVRAFESSKEVLTERRTIAGRLAELDPVRATEYQIEIIQISNQIKIAEGMEMVDASRLHVDREAFLRWARRHAAEDFSRYKALVLAGLTSEGELEDLLRDVFSDLGTRQAYYTPDDQADAILTDLFLGLGQQFLANSDFGLDYYLSKRIRHQSFIGLVRGPLEFANLITSKDSEFGSYRSNAHWLNRLGLGEAGARAADVAFRSFSERFDQLLITLKDDLLQIKTAEKVDGLFEIFIGRQAIFVSRTMVQAGVDFDSFIMSTYQLFWQAMEPCLSRARDEIGVELKDKVVELIQELREQVRRIADDSPAFQEFSTEVSDASVEVQRALDKAASWFVKPDAQPKAAKFTLKEAAEIALQSAMAMHVAFAPEIELALEGGVDLQPPDLMLIWETIFVGIDNAKRHSGIRQGARVQIRCTVVESTDSAASTIELELLSELAKPLPEESLNRLEAIRHRIAEGKIGQVTKREGGSGLIKVASVVNHTPGGQLDFGPTDDGRFRLFVRFRPTKNTVALVRLADENPNR